MSSTQTTFQTHMVEHLGDAVTGSNRLHIQPRHVLIHTCRRVTSVPACRLRIRSDDPPQLRHNGTEPGHHHCLHHQLVHEFVNHCVWRFKPGDPRELRQAGQTVGASPVACEKSPLSLRPSGLVLAIRPAFVAEPCLLFPTHCTCSDLRALSPQSMPISTGASGT